MADGAFLPLDTYIKSSLYLDPSAQVQSVFNAGKVNGEQVVLPLLYRVNTYLLDKAQMQDPNAQYMSFDALKTCKDDTVLSVLQAHQASWYGAQLADVETASEFSVPTAENEVADAEISLTGGAWYEDGFTYYAQNKNDTYALTVPNDADGVDGVRHGLCGGESEYRSAPRKFLNTSNSFTATPCRATTACAIRKRKSPTARLQEAICLRC